MVSNKIDKIEDIFFDFWLIFNILRSLVGGCFCLYKSVSSL